MLTAPETSMVIGGTPEVVVPDADPFAPAATIDLCLDGAMVSLAGGEWQEVRTLTVGEVITADDAVRTTHLNSISQLTPATNFRPTIGVKLTRRGMPAHPGTNVAISNGLDSRRGSICRCRRWCASSMSCTGWNTSPMPRRPASDPARPRPARDETGFRFVAAAEHRAWDAD